jgi:ubiquinone/menaquinone biosynthesis C-methylase UbiE
MMKKSPLPSDESVLPVDQAYDRWAPIYDSDGNPLIYLEEPAVRRLLGDVRGLEVADIGCGTGRHAIWMAAAGARVTALDFSAGMLSEARRKAGAEAVRFVRHDITRPLPLRDAAFDRVVCGLVVEHVNDFAALFAELRRICSPEGRVVVTAMHPAMMLGGIQARFQDPATGQRLHPRSRFHTAADLVMAGLGAGLCLDHMGEHAVDDQLAAAAPRAAKYLGWLLLLTLRFRPKREQDTHVPLGPEKEGGISIPTRSHQ